MIVAGRAFQYTRKDVGLVSVARGQEVIGFEEWPATNQVVSLRSGFVKKVADLAPAKPAPAVAPMQRLAPDCWPCALCDGKTFKSASGLAIHRKKIHGI